MRAILSRLRRLERGTDKPISLLWLDQQDDAELQAEIAERKAKGFRVLVVSWKREEIKCGT